MRSSGTVRAARPILATGLAEPVENHRRSSRPTLGENRGSPVRRAQQVPCASCRARWDARTARYCGRCGASLGPPADQPRDGRTPRRAAAITVGVVAGLGALVAGTLASTAVDPGDPTADPGSEVALPDELGEPAELTPEQRASLERFDPDRVHCEPDGCELARWSLDTGVRLATVGGDWLALLDGTTLRVRPVPAGATANPGPEGDEGGYDLALTSLFDERPNSMTRPPSRLAIGPDGTVGLLWPERLVVLGDGGEEVWRLEDDAALRFADVAGGRLLVLREDRTWAEQTDARPSAGTPVVATGHALTDGREVWRRDAVVPLNLVDDHLLVAPAVGGVELLDLADGTPRWQRALRPAERVQVSSGPWLLLSRPDGAALVDARTGADVAEKGSAALLTGFVPTGELWTAAWLDGRTDDVGLPGVSFVAMGDDGTERWRIPLAGLDSGRCCPAALPWADDAVALFDPATGGDRWLIVDAATGQPRDVPVERQPELAFPVATADRTYATGRAPGLIVQEAGERVAVVAPDGRAQVRGSDDLEVVSLDPLVVAQGRDVLAVRRVPPGAVP